MPGDERGRVGVRELRQNLSVYLQRVKEGETLEVTERGRAVARLTPLPAGAGILERMVAEGRAVPAEGPLDRFLDARVPLDAATADRLGDALRRQRRDKV